MRTWHEWSRFFEAQGIGPNEVFQASAVARPGQQSQGSESVHNERPTPVALPAHLFVPNGAQSLDLRRLALVSDGSINAEFFRFVCPEGATVHFLAYSIFSDGTLASPQEFIPRVNGNRVFGYHGDPNDGFKMNLGLGPDMSNANLIQCQLTLQPKDVFTWSLTNTAGVEVAMGVRMVGYIDESIKRVSSFTGVG